jgi:uncharacterized repeat protein (TIGR03847 family)
MAHFDPDDVRPVQRITAGAVGNPGRRVFVLEASIAGRPQSWVIGKDHAVALGRALPRFLEEVHSQFPELAAPVVAAQPNLTLSEPIAPQFRVSNIGLGYDRLHDLVVFTLLDSRAENLQGDELFQQEQYELRVFVTRGQALLLGQLTADLVAAGRPACPRCGEPIDEFGHFCLSAGMPNGVAGLMM